ncbi:hypothetical protein NKI98_29210 [Mesorhizobium sp. M0222]|uniref:hypothetical protein n=1 Tax=Mesorhizobium sp. M0222 TaxID=2956921 RepID=UPI00333D31AF
MPLLSSGVMACREAVELGELLREGECFRGDLGQRKKQTSSSPWMGAFSTFAAAGQQHGSCPRLPSSMGTKQQNLAVAIDFMCIKYRLVRSAANAPWRVVA